MNGLDDSSLLLITAVGSAVAAIAACIGVLIGWLNYRSRHKDPLIVARTIRRDTLSKESKVEIREVTFTQSDTLPFWLVRDVKVSGLRRNRWISRIGEPIQNKYGEIIGFHQEGEWSNQIVFDPPISSPLLLLHSEANTFPKFSVGLAMRNRPSKTRRVVVIAGI